MCEDSDGCTNWFFPTSQGSGQWSDNAIADLTITHYDGKSISVHRVDAKGAASGLTADYSATINNFWAEGDVVFNWPGHFMNTHVKWHAMLFPPPEVTRNTAKLYEASLPHATTWFMCEDFGSKCDGPKPTTNVAMVISGRVGILALLDNIKEQTNLYVDQLPGGTWIIRRLDRDGPFTGATLYYVGKLVDGRLEGTSKTSWPGHMDHFFEGKWNAFTTSPHCTPAMDIPTARNTAALENLSENRPGATRCYAIAADKGDSDSQDTAGEYYYVGWGAPPDYRKALIYLQKGADQGNVYAMKGISIYFREGKAEPSNLLLANYYANTAEYYSRTKALLQTTMNGSGHGTGAALDMIGNLGAYVFFGGAEKDEELGATVGHQQAVIAYMNNGMSRVDSEQKVFQEDEADQAKDQAFKGNPCDSSPSDTPDYQLNSQQREEIYLKHSACAERQERSAQQPINYLRCVQNYKESNAIEEHCKYFP
jgi:TPR repeat protein